VRPVSPAGVPMEAGPGDGGVRFASEFFALAEHLGPDDPFGLTRSEIEFASEVLSGNRFHIHNMIRRGDPVVTLVGRRIVEIPEDWRS
jgi:hypothetical protein